MTRIFGLFEIAAKILQVMGININIYDGFKEHISARSFYIFFFA